MLVGVCDLLLFRPTATWNLFVNMKTEQNIANGDDIDASVLQLGISRNQLKEQHLIK